MFKKSLIAGAVIATLGVSGTAFADDAASPWTFTGNIGLYSQYVFRGLTQTNEKPAYQGGFDFSYNFGPASFYLGTWGSNITWLTDSLQYTSSSLESDWYGGFRGNFGKSDFTYDVGYLYYWYPGEVLPIFGEKGDTQEVYAQLGYKWITAKYSYGVGNSYFAVRDADGTWYLNLTATVPLWDSGFTATAHWGDQKYTGTDNRLPIVSTLGTCTSNDDCFSYTDWLVGVSYDMSKLSKGLSGVTFGVNYTNTDAKDVGYTNIFNRNIGKDEWTFYLSKAL